MKRLTIFLLATSLALGACATNPVSGKKDFALVSESEEIKQGRQYHQQILLQYDIYDDPKLQQYVNDLGQRLAAGRLHLYNPRHHGLSRLRG